MDSEFQELTINDLVKDRIVTASGGPYVMHTEPGRARIEQPNTIVCQAGGEEMLRVGPDGFWVRGEKVPQDEKEALAITKIIEDMAVIPAVVFIDTMHRNMVGDENKSDDMAKFFKCIELLIAKLGCAIVIVHHSGHGDKSRARGSSSIKAAMDAEFCVTKEGMTSVLSCTKSKDFEGGSDTRFGIKQVELEGEIFFDEDDQKQTTSVYLEYIGTDGIETKLSKKYSFEVGKFASARDFLTF